MIHHAWSSHNVRINPRECECTICGIKYWTQDALQCHIERVHLPRKTYEESRISREKCPKNNTTKPFNCNKCTQNFHRHAKFKRHLHYHKFMDFKGISMICNICQFATTSIQSMTCHMFSSHDIRMNAKECKCTTCGFKFCTKDDLQIHIEKYHRGNDPLTCNICSQSFKDQNTITRHFRHHELMDFRGTSVFCKFCEYSSLIIHCMIQHVLSSHNDRINASVHECGTCGETFFEKETLSIHTERLHTDQLLCNMCALSFPNKNKLKKHMHYHEFMEFRGTSKICKHCEFSTTTIQSMAHHMLSSHNIRINGKERECKTCGEKFWSRSTLSTHVGIVHQKRKFKCKLCNLEFPRPRDLSTHMLCHHSNREKSMKCSICSKLFSKKEGLTKHMRTHTGETPYKCSFCDRAFTLKQNLDAHLRLHTGDKPYKCEVCGLAFRHNVSKKNHMKYHKDVPGVVYTPPVNNRKYIKMKKNDTNESDDDLPLSNLVRNFNQ